MHPHNTYVSSISQVYGCWWSSLVLAKRWQHGMGCEKLLSNPSRLQDCRIRQPEVPLCGGKQIRKDRTLTSTNVRSIFSIWSMAGLLCEMSIKFQRWWNKNCHPSTIFGNTPQVRLHSMQNKQAAIQKVFCTGVPASYGIFRYFSCSPGFPDRNSCIFHLQ